MNRLISIVLACLLQASLAVAATFNLDVAVTPHGAGSLNTSGGTYEEGSSIYLRTYGNTGFVFKGWYEDDKLLSSSNSFNYTMPSKDVLVQARYEYDPVVPDNPAIPDTTTYYSFETKVSPNGAGSLNITSGKYAAGAMVNLRAYVNTGFLFVGWQNEAGETVSSSTSFNYTMPRHDSKLTALYVYDPSVPANPDSMATRYTVTVDCKPAGSGTFNTTSATAEEGGNVRLYAYTNTGFKFLYWEDETGEIISTVQNFYYVIPHGNSKVYGIFEYDPAVPSNPNKNYWNKELGEVIVDDFTPGSLNSAVSAVISGSNYNDVAMITVAGKMNDNDFGIANSYTNCTLLDLSRVTGITQVPSYAFDYTNLESVYLPATIEKICYRAFYECKQLSSLTVYAMSPPMLENQVFTNVPEGLVVYVPAAAIAQYQGASGWKDFTILPIQEDIRSISISLPEGTNVQDYKQMWLELTNTKSGQKMHYVMTDRMTYVFANIIGNTSWNVVIRNERGDVFGQIDNVEVKDEDASVTFTALLRPQNVVLSVLTPEGQDVTNQTQITWTDAQSNYVAQGTSLSRLPVGYQANYRIVLSQDLAMVYDTPLATEYTLKDGGNDIICQLDSIKQVQLSGKVKDALTVQPLNGAVISASQTFGGKYSKTLNAKTDKDGKFTMKVAAVPMSVAFAATGYISQAVNYDNGFNGLNEFVVPDVSLKSITGAIITVVFTYTTVDGETRGWYSDYQNVGFELFNITKDCVISQFNVQYPQIVLLEEVEDGDVLKLIASSRTNAFKAVEATATIANQKAEASFAIKELGQIQATFMKKGNASVVGTLYDASGKLVNTYNYANASLTISDLADGQYTLVSMGNSRLFNTIYDLAQLPQTGLAEGVDYVKNAVEVTSGAISKISIDEVPTLDESKLYYTGDNTSFTVNKPSIVAGNYLTLTGRIDFKPAYATSVSNVQMIVDLPESCQFVENSVMVGNSTSSYTLNGNHITIPMARYTDRVRFCVIPTLGGDYAPSAFAQFDLNGETITQPIGSANYIAKDLSINVPSTVAKTSVSISGTANSTCSVEIYDNDVLIGQTTSLANGNWQATCELNEPYNLSTHSIYAKVTTKAGLELQSETVECLYDMNAVQVSKVTMYHWNPEMHRMYESVFDFQNPSTKPNQWTVYYPEKKFTYTIDFTNNSPEKVSNVILYVHTADGQIVPLYPTYDEQKDVWVAEIDMGNRNDSYYPVNVSVDFNMNTDFVLDAVNFDDKLHEFDKNKKEIQEETELDLLLEKFFQAKEEGDVDLMDELTEQIIEMQGYEVILLSDEEKLEKEAEATLMEDSLQHVLTNIISSSFYSNELTTDFLNNLIISHASNLNIDSILEAGFEIIQETDGNSIYLLLEADGWQFVDFKNDIHIIFSQNTRNNASSRIGFIKEQSEGKLSRIKSMCETLEGWAKKISILFNDCFSTIVKATRTNEELLGSAQLELQLLKESGNRTDEVVSRIIALEGDIAKYSSRIQLYGKLSRWIENNIKPLLTSSNKAGKVVGKSFSIFSLVSDAWECYNNINKLNDLEESVKIECVYHLEDVEPHLKLRSDIHSWKLKAEDYYYVKIGADIASVAGIGGGLISLIPSGGTSTTAIGVSIAAIVVNIGASVYFNWRYNKAYAKFVEIKNKLPNPCGNDDGDDGGNGGDDGGNGGDDGGGNGGASSSRSPNDDVKVDPSGYVYEGIAVNRIEGVTATIYYKEDVEDMYGDLHENIVKWDAAEYAQENPLFTDEYGMYRWDVPQGLWQVKFEKEGYETTYSDWLPVPPPQLDVNIAMTQNKQPEVKEAHAYEDGVEFSFDKYMQPALLNTDNILVSHDGVYIKGEVKLMDEETAYEDESVKYASRVRFVPETPFTVREVTLIVSNRVKSYAGIQMQDTYTQSFDIEKEVKQIVVDEKVMVPYQGASIITVQVLPADAAAGKTLHAESASSMLAAIAQSDAVISETGEAQFKVTGELPGATAITFSIDGVQVTASTIANIEIVEKTVVRVPQASLASGTAVYRGTTVTLSAKEGQKIWYTLDGSCPCDENGTRQLYTEPLTISGDVTVKMMAEGSEGDVSDVVTLTYSILQSKAGMALNDGWNWMSFNMKNDEALASTNTALASGTWTASDIIKDNQYVDMYSAAQHKWIGTLSKHSKLTNARMYKIHSSQAQKLGLTGEAVHPSETNISVSAGWNYISYVPLVSMSLSNALSGYEAQYGDVIKSQDAFATYSTTNGWEGDLMTLDAGKGYMLKRNTSSQTSFCYPIPSTNSAPSNAKKEANTHHYADNMNIVGEIYGITIEDGDSLIAYVGGEIRGASRLANGKKVFLTIHGDHDATIALVLQRDGEIIATASDMIGYKSNEVVGTGDEPTAITFSSESVNTGNAIGNIKAIYSINGMKIGTKRLNAVPAGTYIIYSETGGNTHITKLIKQ